MQPYNQLQNFKFLIQIGNNVVGVRVAVRDLGTPKESQIYNWGIKQADAPLDDEGRGESRIPNGVSSGASDGDAVSQSLNTSIPQTEEKGNTKNKQKKQG